MLRQALANARALLAGLRQQQGELARQSHKLPPERLAEGQVVLAAAVASAGRTVRELERIAAAARYDQS